jgi:hypothetical protein
MSHFRAGGKPDLLYFLDSGFRSLSQAQPEITNPQRFEKRRRTESSVAVILDGIAVGIAEIDRVLAAPTVDVDLVLLEPLFQTP